MLRTILLGIILVWASAQMEAQTADLQITTSVVDQEILDAIEYTASIWEQQLNSSVPVKINMFLFPVNGLFLGFTFPNGRRDFTGAPLEYTWYPSCLANALMGVELNPGESDMDIVMAADANWYYGTDGQPGFGQYDFVSVLLHEIGHGLGFVSIGDSQGNEGSFGMVDFGQFAPFVPTFPIPELAGFPGAYDRLLIDGAGQVLTDTMLFPNPSSLLHTAFTGNDVYYSGEGGILANDNQPPKIFAPPVFAFGTSISHLDENAYPISSGNSLMTPYIGTGQVEHEPGPIVLGVLGDIGWGLVSSSTAVPASPPLSVQVWGMDREAVLRLDLPKAGDINIRIVDQMGRIHFLKSFPNRPAGPQIIELGDALGSLSAGYYVVQIKWQGEMKACGMVIFP